MNVPKLRFKEFTDEWISKALNDISCINPKNDSLPEKFIYIDLESVRNGILFHEKIILMEEAPSRAQRTVKKNDILFQTVRPYQQNNYFVSQIKDIPYIASTGYALIRTKENPYFIYSLLYQNVFLDKVLDRCTGTSFPAISSNDLGTIKINIPTIDEQTKIANFLSLLDKKIELQTKKIEDLKLYKKGLTEFEFNKDYPLVPLKNILKERKEYSEKDSKYPHVTLSKDGIYDKGERYNRDFLVKDNSKEYKITKLHDLCYNPANLKFGVICLNEYGNAIFSPIYITFEIDKNINPYYIKHYTTRFNFIRAVRKYEQGTVFERMAVSPEDFLKFNIKLPNIEMQNYIVNKLECMIRKINLEEKKLYKLQELKKGLMQNMFV